MTTDVARPETPTLNDMAARFRARAESADSRPEPHNPQSLQELQKAIYAGQVIVGNDDGTWAVRSRISQIVYEILGFIFGENYTKKANLELGIFFENYLKSFETKSSKFKRGIAADPKNDDLIESTKEAIIRRLRDHELEEERAIRVTQKLGDGTKVVKTLQQLTVERTVLRNHQKLHLQKEEVLKQADYDKLEEKIFELDTLIRNGRKHAYAALGIHRIERQTVAALYRERNQKKIYNKKSQTNLKKSCAEHNKRWLTKDLLEWKKQALEKKDANGRKLPTPNVQKELTAREKEKIAQTCFFPKFVKLLKEDPQIREEYYKFVFRNTADGGKDAADIAVQLPVHQKKLMKSILDKREGRLHDLFKIEEAPFHQHGEHRSGLRKFVSLKIEGQHCDIFDEEKKVVFDEATPYKVTRSVKEVFRSFYKKNEEMGEYEAIQSKGIVRLHGVINPEFGEPQEDLSIFYSVARSIYNFFFATQRPLPPAIDLHRVDWMKQMKPLETLSHGEVVARYAAQPEHALIAVRATRGQPPSEADTVMIDDSHSFLELVVPNEQGKYDVFPLGKYAFPYPRGALDTLFYIFNTQRGTVRMDENSFYNHRHHAAYSLQASAEHVKRFWEKLRRDLNKERNNEVIFQAQGDNCSAWVEETLQFVFQNSDRPRFFDVHYTEASGPTPVSYIMEVIKFAANAISATAGNITRIAISVFFGAWHGYTTGVENDGPVERLVTNETWRNEKLMLPGTLFRRCHGTSKENMKGYLQLKTGHAA